jgi:hypothetical protein
MVCADTPHLVYDDGLTEQIIGLAIKVHRYFGPGLMESVYEACLCLELKRSGLAVARPRVSGCRVGLLMNFNCVRLKDGLRRFVM